MHVKLPKRQSLRLNDPDLSQQGASALLAAVFEFLLANNISPEFIRNFIMRQSNSVHSTRSLHLYKALVDVYDDMGVIMATWFSQPQFLNSNGDPIPLSSGLGRLSISNLIRVSGAKIKRTLAIDLMKESPSVRFSSDGKISALRRVFVLAKFDVPRAAFVIERYLDTLNKNNLSRKNQTVLLLERSCYVPQVDLSTITPMIREIDCRGTAFMDSIDGDMESRRLRQRNGKGTGELGVVVFAWAKPKGKAGINTKNKREPRAPRLTKQRLG